METQEALARYIALRRTAWWLRLKGNIMKALDCEERAELMSWTPCCEAYEAVQAACDELACDPGTTAKDWGQILPALAGA